MTQPKSEILAIIPGKGTSSRVPQKNLRTLGNKPLIAWTIEAALGSRLLTRIVVSTEDHRVAAVAQAWGVEVVSHPALDELPEVPDVCLHVLDVLGAQGYEPDVVCCLLPSSPFRTAEQIDEALALDTAGVLSVSQPRHHRDIQIGEDEGDGPLISRHPTHNGAILITPPDSLIDEGFFNPSGCLPYHMDPISGLDINTMADFKYAERIAAKMLAKVPA